MGINRVLAITATGSLLMAASLFPVAALAATPTVSPGDEHVVALKEDGTVWAWGSNESGRLGQNIDDVTLPRATQPLKVVGPPGGSAFLENIVQVAAGGKHTLALKSDGTVWAWGYNYHGQLGNGSSGGTAHSNRPVQVTVVGGSALGNVAAISAGSAHSLALKTDGTVWEWGAAPSASSTRATQVSGIPTSATLLSAGSTLSFVLDGLSGEVWAWGNNSYGQLGRGTFTTSSSVPARVLNQAGSGYLTGVTGLAAGSHHGLALASGGAYGWGRNLHGQLGDNTTTNRNLPVTCACLTGIESVEAGGAHSLAVGTDDSVWGWGSNAEGEIANETTAQFAKPHRIVDAITGVGLGALQTSPAATGAVTIGERTTAAIFADGTVRTWGAAPGMLASLGTNTPKQVMDLKNTTAVAAGYYHTLAIQGGQVVSWGYNAHGQLGNGTVAASERPDFVVGANGTGRLTSVSQVTGGVEHSVVLKSDGTVWAWGFNYFGQLGNGTQNDSLVPVQVSNLTNICEISTGADWNLARTCGGEVYAWGYAWATSVLTPTLVSGLSGITRISTGPAHNLAVDSQGQVWSWGSGTALGRGGTEYALTPGRVLGAGGSGFFNTAVEVLAGGYIHSDVQTSYIRDSSNHLWSIGTNYPTQVTAISTVNSLSRSTVLNALAVSSGAIWTWGIDQSVQVDESSPYLSYQTLGGFSGAGDVAGGMNHSVARRASDGTVWSWGTDPFDDGQIGTWRFQQIQPAIRLTTNASDNDSDGLLDTWETQYFGGTGSKDGRADSDGDGLLDIDEQRLGSNPTAIDPDGDGLNDLADATPLGADVVTSNLPLEWAKRPDGSSFETVDKDELGYAVAVDGDWAIAGSPGWLNDSTGVAFVYKRDSLTNAWILDSLFTQHAQTCPDVVDADALPVLYTASIDSDFYGRGVAISGNIAVVGSPGDHDRGRVDIYERDGSGVWARTAAIDPNVVNHFGLGSNAGFGHVIALSGDLLVVGTNEAFISGGGKVVVFRRQSSTTWTQVGSTLTNPDATREGFGLAVAIEGDTIVVGARCGNPGSSCDPGGSAFVYRVSGTSISSPFRLEHPDNIPHDLFGTSVAISGDTIMVGSDLTIPADIVFFDRDSCDPTNSSWEVAGKPSGLLGGIGLWFEHPAVSVAVSGNRAVVGVPLSWVDSVTGEFGDNGAFEIFRNDRGRWVRSGGAIQSPHGANAFYFGRTMAVTPEVIWGGDLSDLEAANQAGSAHAYESRTPVQR